LVKENLEVSIISNKFNPYTPPCFTEVFQGEYNKTKVAVKSLKDQTHDLQKFLAEASVMT